MRLWIGFVIAISLVFVQFSIFRNAPLLRGTQKSLTTSKIRNSVVPTNKEHNVPTRTPTRKSADAIVPTKSDDSQSNVPITKKVSQVPYKLQFFEAWFRLDWQFATLSDDVLRGLGDARFLVTSYANSGWGNWMHALSHLFYMAPASNRYLLIDFRSNGDKLDPEKQIITQVVVPRMMAWNITPIASVPTGIRGDPELNYAANCLGPITPPWHEGYIHPDLSTLYQDVSGNPPASVSQALRKALWDIRFSDKEPNESAVSFDWYAEANAMYIPNCKGADDEFFDLYNLQQYRVVSVTSAHAFRRMFYRKNFPKLFGQMPFESEIETMMQLSVDTALMFERTILRTFFMVDPNDSEGFELELDNSTLGSWQVEMRNFMGQDELKKNFAVRLIDGISQFFKMGSLSHCKSQLLMEAIRERLTLLSSESLAAEFEEKFDFHFVAAHLRLGDGYFSDRDSADYRNVPSKAAGCIQSVFREEQATLPLQVMFLSDQPIARTTAFESRNGTDLIVPFVPMITLTHTHVDVLSGDENRVRGFRAMLCEWMFLVVADVTYTSRSGFSETAGWVRGEEKSGSC